MTQYGNVLEQEKLVNIGDMYISEGDNELSLEEIFNKYDIYEAGEHSTALVKSQNAMPPAVPNGALLGRQDEFSL